MEEKVILGTWDDGSDCDDDNCFALKTCYVSGMVLNTYGQYLTSSLTSSSALFYGFNEFV